MTRTTRCIDLGGTWTFGSPSVLMMFHRTPGQLDEENAQMRACMPYYYKVTDGHGSGAEHSMQCETDLLRGRFTDAEIGCHLARDAAQARGQYSILLTAEFTALRLSLLQHGEAGIDETLAQLHGTLKSQRQFLLLRTLDLCQAWLDAMRGRADPGAWYLTPEADASFLSPVLPMLRIVQNEVLLALGEWTKLLARGESCAALNTALHTCLADIYLHIQLACAQFQLGRREDAQRELGTARRCCDRRRWPPRVRASAVSARGSWRSRSSPPRAGRTPRSPKRCTCRRPPSKTTSSASLTSSVLTAARAASGCCWPMCCPRLAPEGPMKPDCSTVNWYQTVYRGVFFNFNPGGSS